MLVMNSALLRKDAHNLLDRMSEDKLVIIVEYMQKLDLEQHKSVVSHKDNSDAFKRLEQLCRPIPDLDYDKELEEWRREKYGY